MHKTLVIDYGKNYVISMNKKYEHMIESAEQLELNVAELYSLFNKRFPEDSNFWFQLIMEEDNHGDIIKKIGELDLITSEIIKEILPTNYPEIKAANKKILSLIDKYKSHAPSREEAFNVALEIEKGAVEIHYSKFMKQKADDKVAQAFQKLNKDDIDHYKRIRSYMEEHGIKILSEN